MYLGLIKSISLLIVNVKWKSTPRKSLQTIIFFDDASVRKCIFENKIVLYNTTQMSLLHKERPIYGRSFGQSLHPLVCYTKILNYLNYLFDKRNLNIIAQKSSKVSKDPNFLKVSKFINSGLIYVVNHVGTELLILLYDYIFLYYNLIYVPLIIVTSQA